MKVTLNWLKQYVDFDWSPAELGLRLTMAGIEVEGVQEISGEFAGIVVAQVVTRDPVAGSDKLSVCRVNDGKGERQVICGAQNYKPGDKVPLILPNSALPLKPGDKAPFVIKVRKVMGVESHGMLCSPQELGLPDEVDGLLILPADARVGQPFAEFLGRPSGDIVYDLEITPNRPDLNSVIGIAREISAVTGNPLKLPDAGALPTGGGTEELVTVRITDSELCPRYTARIVRGVKIGPPDWLRSALEKVGVRAISNVVDVTNFVMLETGQPLHAFDYHLLAAAPGSERPVIVVRRAADGEKFTTLDDKERTLTSQMLLIADETRAVALAGIMGGLNSEINDRTVDVLIESASFKPQNIRATSKQLELRTESSYRFERGGDVGICEWAGRRAVQLILQTAGGVPASGLIDAYPNPAEAKKISLRHRKIAELLGVSIPAAQNEAYLRQLGLEVTAENDREACTATIPSFRVDLKREADLIEEITRLYGVDKIPSTPPRGATGANAFDTTHDSIMEARRILSGLGLDETQGQTLITGKAPGAATAIPLANPLSGDMDVLRPSLLPGLLDALRRNVSRKNNDAALFEVGRVFSQGESGAREERRAAIAVTGRRNPPAWSGAERDAKWDIYDLKGLLEDFLARFGVRGAVYTRRPDNSGLYLESASIQLGRNTLGEFGWLSPALAREYDLRDAVLLAELNLDLMLALPGRGSSRTFKPLPAFPAIRRDVAMLVPETTTHDAVLTVVKQAKPQNLESAEVFDVFRGKNVPDGSKSLAYVFTYRGTDRTLNDAEVNAAHEKLVEQFKQRLGAAIRE